MDIRIPLFHDENTPEFRGEEAVLPSPPGARASPHALFVVYNSDCLDRSAVLQAVELIPRRYQVWQKTNHENVWKRGVNGLQWPEAKESRASRLVVVTTS